MASLLPQHKLHVFLDTAANMAAASFFAGSTNLGHEPITMTRAIATSKKAGRGMTYLLAQHKLHVFLATAANMAAASFFARSTNLGLGIYLHYASNCYQQKLVGPRW
ncbi:hypothetical protein [Siphonobacter sp. SORGH_AS_0500]|uniref:hypothetical protein n=1 Tax=Siphonobacter sp. SORGH_AS_0500 TaxID=1864824 RepID=UPI0028605DDC|nr:hypothetical protein [Siphonobacter sp. SORGH_AS_0500]MDR6195563.1 Pyruvate/2-oxoacid:ferredoxin oxidoreductase gamma subunit [Siphonobacter sp. SORGH_AS_0500]